MKWELCILGDAEICPIRKFWKHWINQVLQPIIDVLSTYVSQDIFSIYFIWLSEGNMQNMLDFGINRINTNVTF